MAGNPKQKLKLLYIADYLQKHTDASHPASTDDIIAFLRQQGVSSERKSIYNDIDVLKEYGLLIEHSRAEPRGYYIADSGLDTSELILLLNALQASPVISRGKTAMLSKKLRQMVSVYQSDEVVSLTGDDARVGEYFGERSGFFKSENEEFYQNIDAISRAIAGEKKISFIYRRRRLVGNLPVFDNGREFIISPYAAIWNDDRYYLVGNNEKYDDLSHYRIDRMKMVTVLDAPARPSAEVSRYPKKFNAADYSRGLFNMYSGGEETTVVLICRDTLLETMVERFGTGSLYRQLPGDRFSLKTKVNVSDGFINWVLSFGGDVTVDEPQQLCDEIKSRIERMRAQY